MSQNQKSFDLGKYFYLNLPDLKNYLFWSHGTDSKGKRIIHLNNAYFAILSQNPDSPWEMLSNEELENSNEEVWNHLNKELENHKWRDEKSTNQKFEKSHPRNKKKRKLELNKDGNNKWPLKF